MAITDYPSLIETVKKYCSRSDAVFSNQIDTFLFNAENHIYFGYGAIKPIRLSEMINKETITFTNGVAPLPTRYLSAITVIDPRDLGTSLEYRSPQEFVGFSNGKPIYYTLIGTDIHIAPTYSGDIDFTYYVKYERLGDSAPINHLIAEHPNIYLEAVLMEAYSFLRDQEEVGMAAQRFAGAMAGLNNSEKRKLFSGNISRPTVRGGFNGGFEQVT